jgi:hypothetical protein
MKFTVVLSFLFLAPDCRVPNVVVMTPDVASIVGISGTPVKKRTIPHYTFLLSYLRGSPQLRAWGHFDSHKDGIFLFKKLWHLWQKATNATNATNATKMPQMPYRYDFSSRSVILTTYFDNPSFESFPYTSNYMLEEVSKT